MRTILESLQWAILLAAIALSVYCIRQFHASWKRIAEIHAAVVRPLDK